ncbi:MAG TPA: hypothetical protein DCZ03_14070 [Gammaproteobacteria bacterium]|nr:hypothetical protein [Gammaproteobacteria bacterium]
MKKVLFSLVIIIAGLLIAGFIWVQSNREELHNAYVKGQSIGAERGAQMCMDWTLEKSKHCSSINISCMAESQLVLSGCLQSAEDSAVVCMPVPSSEESDATGWVANICQMQANGSESCPQLMSKFLMECDKVRNLEQAGIQ